MQTMELCGACAHSLSEAYHVRKVSGGVDNKVVCAKCRKKRYGGTYELEAKREGGGGS